MKKTIIGLLLLFSTISGAYIYNPPTVPASMGSLNGQTGATQTFANDVNVIITSSNNTHQLGWAGTLSLTRGGTQNALTAANGGIVYSDATKLNILAAGTSGLFLKSNGAAAPSWTVATTSAAGSENQIQFNSGGSFAAQSGFVWDATNFRLGINQATPLGRIHANAGTTSGAVGAGAMILGVPNTTADIGINAAIFGGSTGANTASGQDSHVEGGNNSASGPRSHVEGTNSSAGGQEAHAEGNAGNAGGNQSHAEGLSTSASAGQSHAEGSGTTASATASHAEGTSTLASGLASHAEGATVQATGSRSHAEGFSTSGGVTGMAAGIASHSEGTDSNANGTSSHAEGNLTVASGTNSHSSGLGTTAQGFNQLALGQYNVLQGTSGSKVSGDSSFIIGNGASDGARANAFAVLNTGEMRLYGSTSNYVGLISPASPTAHTTILPSNAGATGGVLYYSSTDTLSNLVAGTSGQVLTSGGAATPTWSLAVDATKLPLAGGTMSGAINMGGFGINNMLDPASGQDAATKAYVDNLINGLTWKAASRLATTAALPANTYNNGASGVGATLTEVGVGALTIDGSSAVVGNRVLIKNEVTAANNGIYSVTVAGSGIAAYVLTRTADFDQSADISEGDTVFIEEGTANTSTAWSLTTSGTVTVGTTALNFAQVSGPGSLIAGTGISISGSTISLITPVVISSGGTNNASLGPVLGGIVYTDATKLNTLAAGTSGQFLKSNGGAAPSWVVPTDTGITSLNAQTGVTQVFANDSNVVITSSGNTHTLGWAGTLSLTRGGTGASITSATGGVVYGASTSAMSMTVAGTSGQILTSNGAAAPSWQAPAASGITSLNAQTGATQVFANDANVIITSSNNTHSFGWSGTLSLARGGSGSALTAGQGRIAYSDAVGLQLLTPGTSGQVLVSQGAAVPVWTSPIAIGSGGTNNNNLSVAAGSVYYGDASKINAIAAGTSGQVLVSGGAGAPSWGEGNLKTRSCTLVVGADNGTAIVDADLGPQLQQCYIPLASTVVEIDVRADAGTPSVLLQKRTEAATVADLLSAALATGASGAIACAKSGTSQTCINGTTSSGTITISNTSLAAGDWIELKSGTAGGTAKRMSVVLVYTVN